MICFIALAFDVCMSEYAGNKMIGAFESKHTLIIITSVNE